MFGGLLCSFCKGVQLHVKFISTDCIQIAFPSTISLTVTVRVYILHAMVSKAIWLKNNSGRRTGRQETSTSTIHRQTSSYAFLIWFGVMIIHIQFTHFTHCLKRILPTISIQQHCKARLRSIPPGCRATPSCEQHSQEMPRNPTNRTTMRAKMYQIEICTNSLPSLATFHHLSPKPSPSAVASRCVLSASRTSFRKLVPFALSVWAASLAKGSRLAKCRLQSRWICIDHWTSDEQIIGPKDILRVFCHLFHRLASYYHRNVHHLAGFHSSTCSFLSKGALEQTNTGGILFILSTILSKHVVVVVLLLHITIGNEYIYIYTECTVSEHESSCVSDMSMPGHSIK